jgi:hypothetical protein
LGPAINAGRIHLPLGTTRSHHFVHPSVHRRRVRPSRLIRCKAMGFRAIALQKSNLSIVNYMKRVFFI